MSLVEKAIEKLRLENAAKVAAAAAKPQIRQTVAVPMPSVAAPATPAAPKPIGTLLPAEATAAAAAAHLSGRAHVRIDRDGLRALGYMPDTSCDRQFAGHYRQIKRPLIATALEGLADGSRSRRLIMMASALPGDGKTFTSINLAMSMSRERDISVLLVDADVAKPHVSELFGLREQRGLLDSLTDKSLDVESFVLPTDVNGLSILPAGTRSEGATELIASSRMGALVSHLLDADPRRIVLFDSPPLLVSSESRELSKFVGQVLLVVRASKTPQRAVLDAVHMLGDEVAVGLVLNQGRPSMLDGIYGYGYGYGAYGEYGNDTPVQ